ncbi:hypothetical protein T484DRAFT_1810419 [Baffinella frigidus]|nr:hypothetical protein T484DRAFT_1810419 [Cryptophyta sp. CCMP2293]
MAWYREACVILTEHTNTERGFLPRMGQLLEAAMKARGCTGVPVHVSQIDADPLRII